MVRSWGFAALTGAAQPVFGDVLTAAMLATNGLGIIQVTVGSTTPYKAGDRIYIDPGVAGTQDMLLVQSILSGTVLACMSEGDLKTKAHANSALIQLSIPCGEVLLTAPAANAGTTYVGMDATAAVAGGSSFTYVSPGGSYNLGLPEWNTLRTSDLWMIGTAADKIGTAAIVI